MAYRNQTLNHVLPMQTFIENYSGLLVFLGILIGGVVVFFALGCYDFHVKQKAAKKKCLSLVADLRTAASGAGDRQAYLVREIILEEMGRTFLDFSDIDLEDDNELLSLVAKAKFNGVAHSGTKLTPGNEG